MEYLGQVVAKISRHWLLLLLALAILLVNALSIISINNRIGYNEAVIDALTSGELPAVRGQNGRVVSLWSEVVDRLNKLSTITPSIVSGSSQFSQ